MRAIKVVIVYESMFGNTRALARAVAEGLQTVMTAGFRVTVVPVGEVRPEHLHGAGLIVVAAPTHALSMSRPQSRAEAVAKGAPAVAAATGVREWLPDLEDLDPRPEMAVFDTRAAIARHWPGSAGRQVARVLRHRGFPVVDRASFYVEAVTGPLVTGEQERARAWGRHLAGLLAVSR